MKTEGVSNAISGTQITQKSPKDTSIEDSGSHTPENSKTVAAGVRK